MTPPAHGPSYYVRTLDDTALVTPLTDLDATLAGHMRDDLMEAAATHPRVLVDLEAVKFIDSAALGLLVRARQEARQHGAAFALIAPSPFVQTVLHTMRLDRAFITFPDRDAALSRATVV
ncbi:STAS domain-containing protein [Actinoplanes sp. NPDC048796]|uniref:STAS domain-containing protein n=1 Tax=unclassified Actinoplanes TaxID=2626549 RepID=UPI0033DC008E